METLSNELRQLVNDFSTKLKGISENEFAAKPIPGKWSKKEVLGHLVDSAHNNLRRFIVGQYEGTAPKVIYDQDYWVRANAYQKAPANDVIELWRLMNERIAVVMTNISKENLSKQLDTGKGNVQLHNIAWLFEDYIKHMKHHLNQIMAGSFDIVYK